MANISRPEDPELDKVQMQDLREFLSTRSPSQLKKDLEQTTQHAESDPGPYKIWRISC